ncbi:hypothetical protein PUN28_011204 [Cardiocondyla obscurior]|uniref:Uncharacterized protein n=1 Tax=Cardiocondyla obscurior TaxID=286306 RepID=A0AAW2FLY7_9HYME
MIPADAIVDSAATYVPEVVTRTGAISVAKTDTEAAARGGEFDNATAASAAISVGKDVRDTLVIKDGEYDSAAAADGAAKIPANAGRIETRSANDYGTLGRDGTDAGADVNAPASTSERVTVPIMVTDNEIIDDEQTDISGKNFIDSLLKDADAAAAKMKGHAIKDNGERTFRKVFSKPGKSKRGRNTATIGIAERGKRIFPTPSPSIPFLQTYPLCCQLQPHLTCFTDCFDVSPCYCYWTARPLQFFLHRINEFTNTTERLISYDNKCNI